MSSEAKVEAEKRRILFECVDCHATVKGELDAAFETMRQHTLGAHGREPLRTKTKYAHPTLGSRMEDDLLLRPELMLAA
jgi:hypothetical protein